MPIRRPEIPQEKRKDTVQPASKPAVIRRSPAQQESAKKINFEKAIDSKLWQQSVSEICEKAGIGGGAYELRLIDRLHLSVTEEEFSQEMAKLNRSKLQSYEPAEFYFSIYKNFTTKIRGIRKRISQENC